MASTTLKVKPQAPKAQNYGYSEEESLPSFKPDFSIQPSGNSRASPTRPQAVQPGNHMMTQEFSVARPKPFNPPAQQQGIDDLFGVGPKTSTIPAAPPKNQAPPAANNNSDLFDLF